MVNLIEIIELDSPPVFDPPIEYHHDTHEGQWSEVSPNGHMGQPIRIKSSDVARDKIGWLALPLYVPDGYSFGDIAVYGAVHPVGFVYYNEYRSHAHPTSALSLHFGMERIALRVAKGSYRPVRAIFDRPAYLIDGVWAIHQGPGNVHRGWVWESKATRTIVFEKQERPMGLLTMPGHAMSLEEMLSVAESVELS